MQTISRTLVNIIKQAIAVNTIGEWTTVEGYSICVTPSETAGAFDVAGYDPDSNPDNGGPCDFYTTTDANGEVIYRYTIEAKSWHGEQCRHLDSRTDELSIAPGGLFVWSQLV